MFKKIGAILLTIFISLTLASCINTSGIPKFAQDKIKTDFLNYLHSYGNYDFVEEDMKILKHYATFGGTYILKMNRDSIDTIHEIIIEDKVLLFEDTNTPVVWKNGKFYELSEAYFDGVLSMKNVEELEAIFLKEEHVQKVTFNNIDSSSKNYLPNGIDSQYNIGSCNHEFDENKYIFFYAHTYNELVSNIEKYKDSNLFGFERYKEQFINLQNEYDDNFFNDNILTFYYKEEPGILPNYTHSITRKKDTLTLNINVVSYGAISDAMSVWKEINTIKKADINGVKEIKLDIRGVYFPSSSFTFMLKDEYVRRLYMNGFTKGDFNKVHGIKEIELYKWGFMIDLKFKTPITQEQLSNLVTYLEDNPYIESVGYQGTDYVRVSILTTFYDKFTSNALVAEDFLSEEVITNYQITIKPLNHTPFGGITFIINYPSSIRHKIVMYDVLNKYSKFFVIEDWMEWKGAK